MGICECATLGENVGTSLLLNREEIRNDRLFARSMARWRRRRKYVLKSIVFCLSNRPFVKNVHVFVGISKFKIPLCIILLCLQAAMNHHDSVFSLVLCYVFVVQSGR